MIEGSDEMTTGNERDIGFLHASITEHQREIDKLSEEGKERRAALTGLVTSMSKLETRVARLEWVIGTATAIIGYIVTKVTGLWHYVFSLDTISTAAGAATLFAGSGVVKNTEEEDIKKVKKIKDRPSRIYTIAVASGLFMLIASAINLIFNPISFKREVTEDNGAYVKGPPPLNPPDIEIKCEAGNFIITVTSKPNYNVKCTDTAEIYRYWRLADNALELAYAEQAIGRPGGAHFPINTIKDYGVTAKIFMDVRNIPVTAVDYVTVLSAPEKSCSSPVPGIPGWWGNIRMSQLPIPAECFAQRKEALKINGGLHQR